MGIKNDEAKHGQSALIYI